MAGPNFTALFGGNNIGVAQPSFLSLNPLAASVILGWPIEQSFATPSAAVIIEVSATVPALTIKLSDATQNTPGYAMLFNNVGANTFTVLDANGGVIAAIASGTAWEVYLADNSTVAGTYRVFQFGAGASNANAAALAGAGLIAITTTLNENIAVNVQNANYVSVVNDRATCIEWTGGNGTITLASALTVTSGWFVLVKNAGSGIWTASAPGGQTIDAGPSLALSPGQSCWLISDGANFFTLGLGQKINSIFDFIQIDLTGANGNVVLAGVQLNRVSYRFTGALAGNVNIIVPNTVQQYWVDNESTGAFTLTVKTAAGAGIAVGQGSRNILYSDSANVTNAVTFGSTGFTNGTVGSPSIFFTASPATGFYSPGADQLAATTAGAQRLLIDATGHIALAGATTNAAPTLTVNGQTIVGGVVQRIISPFSSGAATPLLHLQSAAVGGFVTLSLSANNGVAGAADLSLFQNGASGEGQLLNRHATGHLKLGANSVIGIDIDQTGLVSFPVGTSFSVANIADGTAAAPSLLWANSVNWGFYRKVFSGVGANAHQEISFAAQGVDSALLAIGFDGATAYTLIDNLAVSANVPLTDPVFNNRGLANTLYLGNQSAGAATAGAAVLPANPLGFLVFQRGATAIKIPYYAN